MQHFNTPAPISATVDIILGDIRFNASDRADTTVAVEPIDPSRTLDVEAADEAKVEFADGKLRVWHPKLRSVFTRKFGSVKVVVELPTGSDVQGDTAQGEYVVQGAVGSCRLKTAIGGIRVAEAAEARLRTTGGKVTVGHVAGAVEVNGYGDIRIGRVDGDATVKNVSGDITVFVAGAALTAKTTMGDISVGEIGSGTVDLNAAIGKLDVGVPEGTTVRLDAKASTGRVRNHLEAAATTVQSARRVDVRARCNGGDITVHRAEVGHDAKPGAARLSG